MALFGGGSVLPYLTGDKKVSLAPSWEKCAPVALRLKKTRSRGCSV